MPFSQHSDFCGPVFPYNIGMFVSFDLAGFDKNDSSFIEPQAFAHPARYPAEADLVVLAAHAQFVCPEE